MKKLFLTTSLIAFFALNNFSQALSQTDSVSNKPVNQELKYRHSIGSSLFMLGNFATENPPCFYQLNYGFHFARKDFFLAEAITWTYYGPLGLETYGPTEQLYPGKVRAYGIGLGYQRLIWKNLFATAEPTFFLQQFIDTDNEKIQNGFQLYLQFILGYRFEFVKKRLFIEPAYALKYWPVNTNFPESFAEVEEGAPNYRFEPSLNFGFKF
jgi:hypothetical protein